MSILARFKARVLLAGALVLAFAAVQFVRIHAANAPSQYPVRLRSGDRYLTPIESETFVESAATERGGIVQFESLPTESERAALASLGVVLHSYLPDNAYIASIPAGITMTQLESHGVAWVGGLTANDKIPEILRLSGTTPEWAVGSDGLPQFAIGLFGHVDLEDAKQWMAAEFGAHVIGAAKLNHSIDVSLPADNWMEIASDDRVQWIEPFWPRTEHNNSNRVNVAADVAQAAPYSLSGTNVVVGEWDGGRADPAHADFGGRVISMDASAIHPHSTHVAGTVMGAGAAPLFTYKGMAPNAYLLTQQWWFAASEMETEYADLIDNFDMRIATNSWGVGPSSPSVSNCNDFMGNYFAECENIDDAVRGDLGNPVTIVWSAGNERGTSSQYCGSLGFTWGTIMPFGTAKNIITVGAINSNNSTMTSFSSWGPTDDGRLKPEVVAPGCQSNSDGGVTSTKPGSGYTVMCGTSMAAPTVAGCVALWTERWMSEPRNVPFASTVKAVFVESADDLGDPGPEYDFGYGRIDVVSAIDLLDQDRFVEDSITHGDTKSWTFVNDGSLSKISVTLAWDDPGTVENAAVTLINNINLRLIPPSGPAEYLPWVLDPANPSLAATTGVDNRNNLEQVRRTSGLEVGSWTVEVTGANIPEGPQRFSLAFAPGMSLTSTNQPYAVAISASSNPAGMAGVVALPFTLSNDGSNNDTYDVTLTSAHGWSIANNPLIKSVDAHSDSALSFDLTIPPATPYGTVDTVIALAVSQASGTTTARDTMIVTVVSGRAVAVTAGNDSLGVLGHTVQMTARLFNSGFDTDSIEWTVANSLGWTVNPGLGVAAIINGGYADIAFDITVSPAATPGAASSIVVTGASLDDPSATDADTMSLQALDRPPVPVQVTPTELASLNSSTPSLMWTHNAYTPPPPGWDVFSYYVDIADDAGFTTNSTRVGPVADTFIVTPALADGPHHWRVVTFNAFGDSSESSAAGQFETDTQAPQAPALVGPADSLYEADTTLGFIWLSIIDAAQYKWEMAADLAFTSGRDSALSAVPSYDRMFASCSTVVYWRVRAIDAAGNESAPSLTYRYAIYKVGDINFDCHYDILDVVGIVSVAFRNGDPPVPPGRAELLCTPPTDITDVVRLIEIVFRNGAPPCGPN